METSKRFRTIAGENITEKTKHHMYLHMVIRAGDDMCIFEFSDGFNDKSIIIASVRSESSQYKYDNIGYNLEQTVFVHNIDNADISFSVSCRATDWTTMLNSLDSINADYVTL